MCHATCYYVTIHKTKITHLISIFTFTKKSKLISYDREVRTPKSFFNAQVAKHGKTMQKIMR